jgi:tetratricopeptide (TPR) repeat protein
MAVGGYRAAEAYRFRAALGRARQEFGQGSYDAARTRLVQLSAQRPGEGEVDYLLGLSEKALGNTDAALAAWARVPGGSPFAPRVSFERGALAMERGEYALAEQCFGAVLPEPGAPAHEARLRLIELFWLEGRHDEALGLLESDWQSLIRLHPPRTSEAIEALRAHIVQGLFPVPVQKHQAALARAAEQSPEDDRVRLGLANLATRAGRFAEAEPSLEACLRRRPEDPAVWMARLEWAMADDRVDQARSALAHLRDGGLTEAKVWKILAWFADRRGDDDAGRRAWDRVVEADPGDLAALERLAELALKGGERPRAEGLRRRKAELDRALNRYLDLFSLTRPSDPARHASEMARVAEALGRRFEARGFLTAILWRDPANLEAREGLARLDRAEPPGRRPASRTLAARLADLLGPAEAAVPPPAPDRVTIPQFRDDARVARLAFGFTSGSTPDHQLPETMSGGVGLLDYDGDGWLDVYCVQGGTFPPPSDLQPNRDRLFRNRGDGTFEDVTERAGLPSLPGGYGHGVCVGDVDNDGAPDVFVTRWRAYALYHNRGDGRFEDVTARSGLGGDRDWPTSAAFADLDGDGDLDLYVCHYLAWDADHHRVCRARSGDRNSACNPRHFESLPDHVFRNDGGRFVDVTSQAGIVDREGRGLGVVAADLDGDGRIDLSVANDLSANYLFRNRGGFTFEEVGQAAGVAANAAGGYQAGMGVACGDQNGDGLPDLAVTNFFGESTSLFHNLGSGLFADRTAGVGLAAPSRYLLGFGIAFLDANNDGRLDLMTANGHISDYRPDLPYAMPAQLLIGGERGRLTDVSAQAGPPFRVPLLGRGLAAGDLDNDGRVDALIVAQDEPLVYFHNRTAGGHFVTILLEGTASNRDAVGAQVTVESGGRRQVSQRLGGGTYQSAGDPRLHFGLGGSTRVEFLEVRWPSGRVDRYAGLAADRGYDLREGDPEARPLKGWKRSAGGGRR